MPSANDIRKGNVIKYNNEPHFVMEMQHRTPGNLRAFVQAKLRNLRSGRSGEVRFNSTETVEVMQTDRQTLEFSYVDRGVYFFLHPETFEQYEFSEEFVASSKNYLVPNGMVDVLFIEGVPIEISLPSSVALKVVESADGLRGDTASNVQKPAKLETGLTVQVPLFIKEGETIKVSTADGSYLGRA
ncbi:MAG TPA: elongation factor P [Opitutaceae bacterium]